MCVSISGSEFNIGLLQILGGVLGFIIVRYKVYKNWKNLIVLIALGLIGYAILVTILDLTIFNDSLCVREEIKNISPL